MPLRTRSLPRTLAALATTAVAAALVLTGCSSGTSSSGTSSSSGSSDAPFSTITAGTLTVGVPTFPPFIGLENGKVTGPEGKIITKIADEYGLTVKPVAYDFSGLVTAVQQHRIDVAIGSIFRTAERAKAVGLSDPIYLEPGAVISKDGVDAVDDFEDRKVGTIQGYNWVDDLKKVLGDNKLTLYPSSADLQKDLEAGRIDVGIDSYGTAQYLYKGSSFKVEEFAADDRIKAGTAGNPGQTAILYAKDAKRLGTGLDEAIAKLHDDGYIAKTLEDAGLGESTDTGAPRLQ
jgi:polar amino acid transport system substrate-binding protein